MYSESTSCINLILTSLLLVSRNVTSSFTSSSLLPFRRTRDCLGCKSCTLQMFWLTYLLAPSFFHSKLFFFFQCLGDVVLANSGSSSRSLHLLFYLKLFLARLHLHHIQTSVLADCLDGIKSSFLWLSSASLTIETTIQGDVWDTHNLPFPQILPIVPNPPHCLDSSILDFSCLSVLLFGYILLFFVSDFVWCTKLATAQFLSTR